MTRTRTALAVAAMLLLAGCGATDAAESTTPATAATEPFPGALSSAPVAQRYESVEALRDALGAGGYYCTDWQRDDRVALALQSGQCSDADVLMIFTGESAVHEAAQNLKALVTNFVVGENWIVNTDRPYAVTYAIGGTIVEGTGDALDTEDESDDGSAAVDTSGYDLTTDEGLCEADADLTNLELNDAIAPLLGFPADRDERTYDQDEAIRDYKNEAFRRECPARAS
ncbi:hypothetical protein [Tessaracoccus palaemonis]|uniref:Metalloprotease n=1 Tax=Tessaracoccus palaemonis TaxID=2829499 RepID=A0ABX8SFT3_9ACTN|nr:hypothetical protein [Tessaracoccus palaemonis]QXT62257.1 hypothetical protein KDB89_10890 [Tessaracoccus palaemonis]